MTRLIYFWCAWIGHRMLNAMKRDDSVTYAEFVKFRREVAEWERLSNKD